MSNDCIYYTKTGEKLLFHYAENFLYEEVPEGTRVIYAPPPLEAITAVKAATEQAIENPHGMPTSLGTAEARDEGNDCYR